MFLPSFFHDFEEHRKRFSVLFSGSLCRKALNDCKALTEMTPHRIVLWLVDAQITLLAADECSWLIGGNTIQEFVLLWYSFWCIRLLKRGSLGASISGFVVVGRNVL